MFEPDAPYEGGEWERGPYAFFLRMLLWAAISAVLWAIPVALWHWWKAAHR